MKIRIKICCISSVSEAQTAIESGADAIGLVAKMPSGPGPIPDELIKKIAQTVPPPIGTFLLTSETSASGIIKHHQRTNTNTIQIVDLLSDGSYSQIKNALPSVKIVQVIHVIDSDSVDLAIKISENVDAILLDSGNPNLKVKELGGTGRIHDWNLSRQIRENSKCPVFLAGGLNPDNIKQAIQEVRPFAVDVCSGVRTNGFLDKEKVSAFVNNTMII
ncbi:MAG TPA: phosphoribosylanthranilate isomerase [Bacteroidales bacterium]|jgi:phosphoribosylanthranilate isomerase|nr:phosphoribosylanthranilate isomerase [Bacteroidales bacterium]HOX75093.1 phosphoribosylanthranilate isomerase [Bacteroidales bacterium]HQM68672.1 phosphoribosylanthranilate isomerase [Bacteroidales bacterium]